MDRPRVRQWSAHWALRVACALCVAAGPATAGGCPYAEHCFANKTVWFLGNSIVREWMFTVANLLGANEWGSHQERSNCKTERLHGRKKFAFGVCGCKRAFDLHNASLRFFWHWDIYTPQLEQLLYKGYLCYRPVGPAPDILFMNQGFWHAFNYPMTPRDRRRIGGPAFEDVANYTAWLRGNITWQTAALVRSLGAVAATHPRTRVVWPTMAPFCAWPTSTTPRELLDQRNALRRWINNETATLLRRDTDVMVIDVEGVADCARDYWDDVHHNPFPQILRYLQLACRTDEALQCLPPENPQKQGEDLTMRPAAHSPAPNSSQASA